MLAGMDLPNDQDNLKGAGMRRFSWMFGLLALCSLPAMAQQAALAGKWTAKWESNGRLFEARLTLTEQGGTWDSSARSRRDACVGIEAPVEVSYVSDADITVNLAFSKALRGCTDVTLRLHKTPEGTLAGERDAGTAKTDIVLSRD